MKSLCAQATGVFMAFVLITALTIMPVGAAAIQDTQPATNYGVRLSERNAAAKKNTVSRKAVTTQKAGAANKKSDTAKPKLSKRNQAVIDQAEAVKQRRDLVDKANAGGTQK